MVDGYLDGLREEKALEKYMLVKTDPEFKHRYGGLLAPAIVNERNVSSLHEVIVQLYLQSISGQFHFGLHYWLWLGRVIDHQDVLRL